MTRHSAPPASPQRWTCPACGRRFARNGQSHTCLPATSLPERLALFEPHQRAICEAILKALPKIGDVDVEPLRVGFYLKHGPTFAWLLPRRAGMYLGFALPRRLDHARLTAQKVRGTTSRIPHYTILRTPADVDEDVRAWLAESYANSRT